MTSRKNQLEELMKRLAIALVAMVVGGYGAVANAQGVLDHMMCYKMKDPLRLATSVDMLTDLQPEFAQKGCVLIKPIEFCVPATKTNVQPSPLNPNIVGQPLDTDYVCYKAKCPNLIPPPVKIVADQFGRRQEVRYKPTKICVPAKKTPLGCQFVGTTNICGGTCPDPTQRCGVDASGLCTCVSNNTCAGRPDTAGACGGTCPDPKQRCLPDNVVGKTAAAICSCRDPLPPTCGWNSATQTCGGACPNPADKCTMNASGDCTCFSLPPPCSRDTATGACGGACPLAGQTCDIDPVTNACGCLPSDPTPCGHDPLTGQCGGTCTLVDESCQWDNTNGACNCLPSPCGSDAAGVCGGYCPNGDTCTADTTGACNCQGPCGRDPADPLTGQCGGICPAGSKCAVIPGTILCQCQ